MFGNGVLISKVYIKVSVFSAKALILFFLISWKFLVGLLPEVEYLLNLYLMNKTTLDKTVV